MNSDGTAPEVPATPLFSHAAPGRDHESGPDGGLPAEPVLCAVEVPAGSWDAFAGFTEHLHLWWPFEDLSVHGAGTYAAFEEGALVETSPQGEMTVWADVVRWEPPVSVALAWHPGASGHRSTHVRIAWSAGPTGGTRVGLEHGGWGSGDVDGAERSVYAAFWALALARYARFMGVRDPAE